MPTTHDLSEGRPSLCFSERSARPSPWLRMTAASLLLCTLAGASFAEPDPDPWTLRAGASWIDATSTFSDGGFNSDGDLGVSLSVERKLSPWLGLEVGLLHGESTDDFRVDVLPDLAIEGSRDLEFTALTAGLNFHVLRTRSVDLYLGPSVGYFEFGDYDVNQRLFRSGRLSQFSSTFFKGSDEFELGGQLGADFSFGDSPWGLSVSAKYFETTIDLTFGGEEFGEVDFNPWITNLGVSYKF